MSLPASPPSPEDFAALQRLLALKRFETPPPGYFQGFAAKVIARIEAEHLEPRRVWWLRWLEQLIARPALAGALGLALGATLMFGVTTAQTIQRDTSNPSLWMANTPTAVQAVLVNRLETTPQPDERRWGAIDPSISSTEPVMDHASPFSRLALSGAQVQRASYSPGR
jgi:hypothetical protein